MTDHPASHTDPIPAMPEPQARETTAHPIPGGLGLLLTVLGVSLGVSLGVFLGVFLGVGLAITGGVLGANGHNGAGIPLFVLGLLLVIASFLCMSGVKMVAPGEARVIQLSGRYVGTIRADGLRWINPLTTVVLCGDRAARPVLNTGTLYQ